MKKIVSLLLVMVMTFGLCTNAFAAGVSNQPEETQVVITDDGIYIDGSYYTKDQFIQSLDMAQEVETDQGGQLRSAAAGGIAVGKLVAGTWYIPGIGKIVVTAAGVILLGGVVVKVGSWVYNAVVDWFAKKAFNDSAEKALNGVDKNKQNHILNNKLHKNGHNWKNIFNGKDPNWNQLKPILLKVLKDGVEHAYENSDTVFERELLYNGVTVVVRFVKAVDGTVRYFGTAYLK